MIRRTHKARVSRPVFDAPDPIDAYLDALWLSLRNQADRDDLVAEAEDHLREAVERRVHDRRPAHELALGEFGDAAWCLRSSGCTGPRPTPATRLPDDSGVGGHRLGCSRWRRRLPALLRTRGWPTLLLFQVVAGMATLLTSVLMFGLFARAGAARSPRLMLALPVTLLTLAGNTVFTWMWSITNLQLALTLWLALLDADAPGWPGHRPTRDGGSGRGGAGLAGGLPCRSARGRYGDYRCWTLGVPARRGSPWPAGGSARARRRGGDTARGTVPIAADRSAEIGRRVAADVLVRAPITDDSKGDGAGPQRRLHRPGARPERPWPAHEPPTPGGRTRDPAESTLTEPIGRCRRGCRDDVRPVSRSGPTPGRSRPASGRAW